MRQTTNFWAPFRPLQPSIRPSEKSVQYLEWKPNPDLSHFIFCYWELKTSHTLDRPFHYRVVADGCVDIFFELNDPEQVFIMGFCKKFTEFPLGHSFYYCGVRFLPTAFTRMFGIDAATLRDRDDFLKNVKPDLAHFIHQLLLAQLPFAMIRQKLDDYFTAQMAKMDSEEDPRLFDAIELILKSAGMANIESDIKTGLSPRQLRRLFNFYVGTSPKNFSKVIRFQNILNAKPSRASLRKNKLFFDAGYFDQAHFIKEFKNFYGVTPSKAFRD